MQIHEWINEFFFGMDSSIFRSMNDMLNSNPWIFKVARFISYFGDHGYFFIALVILLLVFRRTRKTGIVLAIGMIIGALLNNVILKNLIARPRPYDEVEEFRNMWLTHSKIKMNSYSFPSGHTSTASVIGVGLFIMLNKKYSWLFLFIPLLMGWSRITLFVHYPSDVLFGLIVGSISIVGGYFVSKLVFKIKLVESLTNGDKLF
jgi:undecaprenyl-diphosphatase